MIDPGSTRIRPAAVAGRFYPGDPAELRQVVESLLAAAKPSIGPAPKALVAPHAGYVFSGPIAASAFAQWRGCRNQVRRVVLLGPSHHHAFPGVAASGCARFATPLGLVPVDQEALKAVLARPDAAVRDRVHEHEHALEVQLPFLQVALGEFSLVPLLTGEATPDQIADLLDSLWGGPETRIVISTDLSHYLDFATARSADESTATAIGALDIEGIKRDQACGRTPLLGLLQVARRRGLVSHTIDLRNSGDTAGPRDRVVGYGAFGFV